MNSYGRGEEIVNLLTRAGIRASVDPGAVTPPAVLVLPPDRTFDVACGFSARWTLVALAPASTGANRSTWTQLDDLVGAVTRAVEIASADLVSYTVNGVAYPAYLIRLVEEVIV